MINIDQRLDENTKVLYAKLDISDWSLSIVLHKPRDLRGKKGR